MKIVKLSFFREKLSNSPTSRTLQQLALGPVASFHLAGKTPGRIFFRRPDRLFAVSFLKQNAFQLCLLSRRPTKTPFQGPLGAPIAREG